MDLPMSSFLIRYNRRTGDVQVREFVGEEGRRRALAGRIRAERSRETPDLEIVVLSADSLDELHRTHGRYFKSASELLSGLAARPPSGELTPAARLVGGQ
jgi:hypothetical protein